METESLSDADRAANADALSTVEREIVSLEQMFAGIESLNSERDRLSAAVQSLHTEEAQILSDSAASESVIVKKLIETRARKDVQSARLASTQDKIREQTAALAVQGEDTRKAFARIVAQLWQSRDANVMAALTELFGGGWIVQRDGKRLEMKHLARHTKAVREMRDLDNRLSHPIGDPEQETLALQQQPRIWLGEVAKLVANEPGLVLRNVQAQQQPIEQPAREMASV